MRNLKIKNHTGPGGLTKRQVNHNTRVLEQELKKVNVLCVDDFEHASLLWNGDELNLVITHPKKKQTIYVGYDRWGFVIDHNFTYKPFLYIDQASLEETVTIIKKWYGIKSN